MSERNAILSAAEPIKVNIFNQTYSLRARDGGEHALRVARVVDERMRQIASGLSVCDVTKIAVLAAMHLADELEGMRDHYERELDSLRAQPAPPPVSVEPDTPTASDDTTARAEDPAAPADAPAARSWFEAIFDDEAFDRAGSTERMSNHIPSRLKRPRQQPRPDSPISDSAAQTDPVEP